MGKVYSASVYLQCLLLSSVTKSTDYYMTYNSSHKHSGIAQTFAPMYPGECVTSCSKFVLLFLVMAVQNVYKEVAITICHFQSGNCVYSSSYSMSNLFFSFTVGLSGRSAVGSIQGCVCSLASLSLPV